MLTKSNKLEERKAGRMGKEVKAIQEKNDVR